MVGAKIYHLFAHRVNKEIEYLSFVRVYDYMIGYAIAGLQEQIDDIEVTPGPQGEVGSQGLQGINGTDGEPGPQGEQGPSGISGAGNIAFIYSGGQSGPQFVLMNDGKVWNHAVGIPADEPEWNRANSLDVPIPVEQIVQWEGWQFLDINGDYWFKYANNNWTNAASPVLS